MFYVVVVTALCVLWNNAEECLLSIFSMLDELLL